MSKQANNDSISNVQDWIRSNREVFDRLDQALEELRQHQMGPIWGEPGKATSDQQQRHALSRQPDEADTSRVMGE